ncbi:hypothetical protein [Plantibacter sp. YIM 135249]|uniref:hypothetical protein n=1 Tax=Plantibacter sp. YIM 135249 TaxID=3423918 RepID=UPI003D34162B
MNVLAAPVDWAERTLASRDGYRITYVVLALAALVFGVAVTAGHSLALSPFDEWMYLDYLVKLPTQGYLHVGEPVGDFSMNWLACHGQQAFGPTSAADACGHAPFDRGEFPYGGIQSAQLYTPLYFAPTWLFAAGLQSVSGLDILTAARFSGTLWLIGTVIALAAVLRLYRTPATAAIAVGLLFIASPFSWWTYTFVSTDVSGVLVGALAVLLIERVARGRANAWWFIPLFTVALLFKSVNAIAIGIVLIYAVLRFVGDTGTRDSWREQSVWRAAARGRGPVSMVTGPLVGTTAALGAQLVWLRFVAASAVGPPVDLGEGRPMFWYDVVKQLWTFVTGIFSTGMFELGGVDRLLLGAVIYGPALGWLCVAGLVGSVWLDRLRGARRVAAWTALLASVLAGPALAIMYTASIGEYTDLGARYGANLIPLLLLCVALTASRRPQRRVLLGAGIALYALVLAATLLTVR